jgi:hypothetical protein
MLASVFVASLTVCTSGFAQFRPPYQRGDTLSQTQLQTPQGQLQANATEASPSQAAKPGGTSPVSPPAFSAAPSLLNQPSQPAKVTLQDGTLTVDAHNSTLSEILDKISHSGGMKIRGLRAGNADQRVFGTYGPGTPRNVLSELLNGSGYNVLMLGTTSSGVPRELALSARPAGGVPNPTPQSAASLREEYQENQVRPTRYPPERHNRPEPPRPQSGAQRGTHTPQQILQELEQMRQQQQQNEQPN